MDKKIAVIFGPLMDDIDVWLTEGQIDSLNKVIVAENALLPESASKAPLISKKGLDDKAQNDEVWGVPFGRFVRENLEKLNYSKVPGGTSTNTKIAMENLAGERRGELDVVQMPVSTQNAGGVNFIHPCSGQGLKGALRPLGDIPYTDLDPNSGYGEKLKNASVVMLVKSATNSSPEAANRILDFVEKHNPNATVIALLNGSDEPKHPEILARATVCFYTEGELDKKGKKTGLPLYAEFKKTFFGRSDFKAYIMHGDNGVGGFDIATRETFNHFAPIDVAYENAIGIRDMITGMIGIGELGLFDKRFYMPYNDQIVGNVLPVLAAVCAQSASVAMPPESFGRVLRDNAEYVSGKARDEQRASKFLSAMLDTSGISLNS